MKKIKFTLIITAIVVLSSCSTFLNWDKRINFEAGPGLSANEYSVSVDGLETVSDQVTILDGFGDSYTTTWKLEKAEPSGLPVAFGISIPFYWKDFDSDTGLELGISSKISSPHGGAGLYVEGTRGKFDLTTAIGMSVPIDNDFYSIETIPANYA
jgi:hypothetical protein